jgi:predicted transcriptional regulator
MAQILVRKIDDHAMERLRQLADERKMPLEALARQAIEREAERRTAKEFREALIEIEELRKLSPPSDEDSTVMIRKLREDGPSDD